MTRLINDRYDPITISSEYSQPWQSFSSPSMTEFWPNDDPAHVVTPRSFGIAGGGVILTETSATYTSSITGTTLDILVQKSVFSGTLQVTVDGVATDYDTFSATLEKNAAISVFLGNTVDQSHLVVIGKSGAGSNVYLGGFRICNGDEAKTLELVQAGLSTMRAFDFRFHDFAYLHDYAPSLVTIQLGKNEMDAGLDPADFYTNMELAVGYVRAETSAPIMIIINWDDNVNAWAPYAQALRDLVAADGNLACYDLAARWPQCPRSSGIYGQIWDGSSYYLTAKGNRMLATTLFEALAIR